MQHIIYRKVINLNKKNSFRQKEFTLEELSQFDGTKGNPAYVAIDGIVYDVSREPSWGGGTHFSLYSGNDLSKEFSKCHKKGSILSNLNKVGTIKK